MKKTLTIWAILCMLFSIGKVNGQAMSWTSIENLKDSLRSNPKPIMVFIHTDWCKYCKMQENITFQKPKVASSLSTNFYCIKINAESKEELVFLGRKYKPGKSGDYHTLAKMLGSKNGRLLFPTTVFFAPLSQSFERLQGLQTAKDLERFIIKNGMEFK
ncbi:thioredoxin family protein [Cyclobacterium sp. 1_MG-2023]|uniref:thioredoxin family protein n=1 Tax=Cyclobacterium sp. 1_MG-2023 TaxID=3062681 RepID=UPI0026E38224|nr:thioredoxin family protein [Cyclobacterium sp. 1_MG-2023]MDO6439678.1 thioredoxin family protein [Cyclobacterium sp. 1_MG-2023]